MQNFEDILDLAIAEMQKGASIDVVVSKWPEYKTELENFLSVASAFSSLPKNKVPAPAMQRKYTQIPITTRVWFAWLHISRFAGMSMAALLLITGMTVTAYGATKSLPGQRLFSLKRTAEQIQLHLASSDTERANLQMHLTQERLADAQEVFSSPNPTPQQQVAALQELTDQTSVTLAVVKTAAANSDDQGNSPMAVSLKNITQQQKTLLDKIQSDETIQVAITNDSTKQAQVIKQFQEMVAATNEQATLIALNPNSKPANTNNAASTASSTPATTTPITVTAVSASSTSPSSSSVSVKKVPSVPSSKDSSGTTTDENIIQEDATANQAIGTFIPEDPRPQFKP